MKTTPYETTIRGHKVKVNVPTNLADLVAAINANKADDDKRTGEDIAYALLLSQLLKHQYATRVEIAMAKAVAKREKIESIPKWKKDKANLKKDGSERSNTEFIAHNGGLTAKEAQEVVNGQQFPPAPQVQRTGQKKLELAAAAKSGQLQVIRAFLATMTPEAIVEALEPTGEYGDADAINALIGEAAALNAQSESGE